MRAIALALALTLIAAANETATARVSEIAVKDRANANPSIAALGQFAAVAWGATKDGVTDVYVAVSRDGGRVFGAPGRVSGAGGASLSGEQPPRIALVQRAGREPALVVVWTSKATAGTRLLSARSDDGGKSFGAAAPVPGSEAAGNRGWQSIATNRDGEVVALWLDHRETATTGRAASAPMDHAEHQHKAADQKPADGVARAQLSKLFFATLGRPHLRQGYDGQAAGARALTGGVCYCCKTTIATDAADGIYAAWRHVYSGNIRDVAFTKSTDGGKTFSAPLRVSHDNWVLDGCPENGPSLVVDAAKRIHVAWPTLVPGATPSSEPTLALFYAWSPDGARFTPRQRIPTEGFARHPQIALGSRGDVVVTWDEQADGAGGRRIGLARGAVDGNGTAHFVRHSIGGAPIGVYPAVATTSAGSLVAWTSGPAGQTVLRFELVSQ